MRRGLTHVSLSHERTVSIHMPGHSAVHRAGMWLSRIDVYRASDVSTRRSLPRPPLSISLSLSLPLGPTLVFLSLDHRKRTETTVCVCPGLATRLESKKGSMFSNVSNSHAFSTGWEALNWAPTRPWRAPGRARGRTPCLWCRPAGTV